MSATAKTLLLGQVPNDVWLCSASLVGVMCGGIAIYASHHFHNRSTADYKEPKENLAVNGLNALRGVTIASVAVGWVLVLQMGDTDVPARGWWTLDAIVTGLWCMIRLFGTLLVAASAYVFDAHMSFRIVCVLLPPALMVVDMFSEIRFTQAISCMNAGVCDDDSTLRTRYYVLIARDLTAVALGAINWALGIWLTSLFGWCSNDIVMPRKEHRNLRHKLDAQSRKLASENARPLPQVAAGLRGAMRRHRKKQQKTVEEYER